MNERQQLLGIFLLYNKILYGLAVLMGAVGSGGSACLLDLEIG